MTGPDYRVARLRVAAVLGLMLVAAPPLPPLPSFVTIDWPDAGALASAVHIPHLSVRIAIEVTP